MLITAHRGAQNPAIENTLEAFFAALSLGADLIEFDVRKSKDGVLFVIHDSSIGKLKTYSSNFSDLKNEAEAKGFYLPTLEEVLTSLGGKIKLEVEIKEQGYENEILVKLLEHLKTKDFRIISFSHKSLKRIKKLNKNVELGLIVGTRGTELFKIIGIALNFLKDFNVLNLNYKIWQWGLMRFLQNKCEGIFLWTVDSGEIAEKIFLDKTIAGFSTNKAELIIGLRRKYESYQGRSV